MRAWLIAVAASLLFARSAIGEEQELLWGDSPLLATVSVVRVDVRDQVSGGCFTNAAAIKDSVELIFRRNGLKVSDNQNSDLFEVNVLGRRITSTTGDNLGCNLSLEANLHMARVVNVPFSARQTYTAVSHWVAGSLGGGPDAQNQKVKEFATTAAEKLMNEILKSREEVFAKYPDIKASFESAQ